jgi:hypothetical protein
MRVNGNRRRSIEKCQSAKILEFSHFLQRFSDPPQVLTQVLPEDSVIPPLVVEPCGVSDESGSHDRETGGDELRVGRHDCEMDQPKCVLEEIFK